MSSKEEAPSYFVRVRGKVLGPYTLKQLSLLRDRGQFSQSNEISSDGRAWESAATLDAVFSASPKKKSQQLEPAKIAERTSQSNLPSTTNTSDSRDQWHYSIGGEQLGPVPLTDLQEMLNFGRLTLNDLVWREGMAEWSAASEIGELKPLEFPKRRSRSKSNSGSTADGANSESPLARHFLDYILAGLRSVIGESFVEKMGIASIEVGRYAIYVSILLNLGMSAYWAVKLNDVNLGLLGLGSATVILALQYSAVKTCGTINLMSRSVSLRMLTSAFLDSLVLMLLFGGVVILGYSLVTWIRAQSVLAPLLWGITSFLFCELLALILLHPKALGITFSDRASAGEDAITIVSFFVMLPLRFVPAVFGAGSAFVVLGNGLMFISALKYSSAEFAEFKSSDALMALGISSVLVMLYGILPFTIYVCFMFAQVMIDAIRSIIVLPDRFDHLSKTILNSGSDNHEP